VGWRKGKPGPEWKKYDGGRLRGQKSFFPTLNDKLFGGGGCGVVWFERRKPYLGHLYGEEREG